MGARFSLDHVNLVAYLVAPIDAPAPRVEPRQLWEFLWGFEHEPNRFLLGPSDWINRLGEKASLAVRGLRDQCEKNPQVLSPQKVRELLNPLRQEFRRFSFFVLPFGERRDKRELLEFGEFAATPAGERGLVLIPNNYPEECDLTLLDPLPGVGKVVSNHWAWPGVIFWLSRGTATFVELDRAQDFLSRLVREIEWSGPDASTLEEMFAEQDLRVSNRIDQRTILHLSDLHFGEQEPRRNQRLLLTHLCRGVAQTAKSIVITGDLFNNPNPADANDYENFRSALSGACKKNIVVIPGNHDQKRMGNSLLGFGKRLDQVANLEWSNVVANSEAEVLFICFDSARDPDFARGRVTVDQLTDVGAKLEEVYHKNKDAESYLKVVLVHHHPFSFETKAETQIQKLLSFFGSSDERFLRMEDADQFVEWCARRGAELILHGHKHVQRFVNKKVSWSFGGKSQHAHISAVGCGASLGVGGSPLAYNLINWDRKGRTWSASFLADPGDGSGFVEQMVTLRSL